jgi:hypothetical protein
MSAHVVLDSSGRFRSTAGLAGTTPEALAAKVCDIVNELSGGEASVVSASVLGEPPRAFAMVMLRELPNGTFRSGTATTEDRSDALVQAVLSALGLDDGILAAVAIRWGANVDVKAANVFADDRPLTAMGQEVGPSKLVRSMPAPGRLAVTTEDTEYRVLRLPAVALVVSTAPAASVLDEVDAWMAKAEALGP